MGPARDADPSPRPGGDTWAGRLLPGDFYRARAAMARAHSMASVRVVSTSRS